jgi:hypothetical protein
MQILYCCMVTYTNSDVHMLIYNYLQFKKNTASSYHDHCGEQTILCTMLSCHQ